MYICVPYNFVCLFVCLHACVCVHAFMHPHLTLVVNVFVHTYVSSVVERRKWEKNFIYVSVVFRSIIHTLSVLRFYCENLRV